MLVFTDKDTQGFSDVTSCWQKDGFLFVEYKHILGHTQVDMIPLCNIKHVSDVNIDQWKSD